METTTGSVSLTISGVLAPPTYSSISTYPYNTVVLIETKIPDDPFHFKEGSGVVIGPHTILTASHMLWDSTHQSEANQVWLYPGYYQNGIPNPAGSLGPIKANLVWHNYIVGVPGQNLISQSDSQYDFAVIDRLHVHELDERARRLRRRHRPRDRLSGDRQRHSDRQYRRCH
jgi:hypothetical protein